METQKLIYHLISEDNWYKIKHEKFYTPESLQLEGFIHCSLLELIEESANLYFSALEKIIVLTIDTEKVSSEIKYELSTQRKATFPHIYGELNLDAVIEMKKFEKTSNGNFQISL